MADKLLSLGLDVGTTTSQLIVSELTVENRGSAFTVPELTITSRNILYRSPVIFTPLLGENRVDGEALKSWVTSQFLSAGIDRSQVDTGAVIITGETSRKENARSVLEALSGFAGEFVVTTAGPHLESVLAAKGSGAVAFSEETGQTVLNMDIGGGTTNLALVRKGKILRTGCLNVGGRLIRYAPQGTPTYVSPALQGVTEDTDPRRVSSLLAQALEMAAGLTPATGLLTALSTREAGAFWEPPEPGAVICFSGGVADCIDRSPALLEYGDLGPALGQEIRKSRLCQGAYRTGTETIRATVIGAGCHSTQLSGSTVFARNVTLPLRDLPVVSFSEEEQVSPSLPRLIKSRRQALDGIPALSFPGFSGASYRQVTALADALAETGEGQPLYLILQQDMAKALGQALSLRLPEGQEILCLDRLKPGTDSYLDVGRPVADAFPVVIKTLVLGT
ncbi:MAG: ethanolamine ammonia-lyase reactivating factor EutA [Oscillospiraceae bacterium]|nr:ethanolamine ammonia-lyase reactivating factor EutA [Oscillospiraceae bacterium]